MYYNPTFLACFVAEPFNSHPKRTFAL